MALLIDSSTPAAAIGSIGVAGTLGFTAPAGSLLVAFVGNTINSGAASVTDSFSPHLNWTRLASEASASLANDVEVWCADCPTVHPMATVTVNYVGGIPEIGVVVLTGAAKVLGQTGRTVTATGNGTITTGLTPKFSGSLVMGTAIYSDNEIGPTPGSGQSNTFNGHAFVLGDGSNVEEWWAQYITAPTTANLPVTFNDTAPTGNFVLAAVEILAAPSPTVTAIGPASGPTAGGTPVTITGSGFTGATAVKFGATSAASFTINADTSITATSPAGTGTVDITVTTPSGTSAKGGADQFAYVAPAQVVVAITGGGSRRLVLRRPS